MRGNPYLPKACYMLSKLVLSASTQETYHYLHFTDGKKKKKAQNPITLAKVREQERDGG